MIRLDFVLKDPLPANLDDFVGNPSVGAVIVQLENEALVQVGNPLPSDPDVAVTLESVRSALTAASADAALVVLNAPSNASPTIISYVGDATRPKQRLMYSSAVTTVQEALRVHCSTAQVTEIEEIAPTVVKHKETGAARLALMTESERHREEVNKMEVAPQSTSMPGVSVRLSKTAEDLLEKFAQGGLAGAVFKIEKEQVEVDAEVASGGLSAVLAALSGAEPRFVFAQYTPEGESAEQPIMLYLCPSACKPREKMMYASSRAAFLAVANDKGIVPAKRVEAGDKDEIEEVVRDAFVPMEDYVTEEKAPKPPGKPSWMNGPRIML